MAAGDTITTLTFPGPSPFSRPIFFRYGSTNGAQGLLAKQTIFLPASSLAGFGPLPASTITARSPFRRYPANDFKGSPLARAMAIGPSCTHPTSTLPAATRLIVL